MNEAHALAQKLVLQAIVEGDSSRRLINTEHWPLPDFSSLQHASAEGNHILWVGHKPELKINGAGNVIVLGKIESGELKGVVLGNNNVVLALGQTNQFRTRIDIHGNGAFIYIGSGTRVISAHIVLGRSDKPTSALIGAQSLLSRLVTLRATDSHSIIDIVSGDIINEPESIVVEPHVWLGENATLLKGCSVGAGSIVAAGALVTGHIPARSTCGGIPAKVLRTGTTWTSSPQPSPRQIRAALDFVDSVSPRPTLAAPDAENGGTTRLYGITRRMWKLLTGKVAALRPARSP